ncbi:hypothetical protein GH714_018871 [Hevea brasiliensis]|uniref:J domain-containing protein n=1 Tax=Hevea brasiliensis TaxID=3981 RepID=A0A6A6N2Y9_HEVBR|nr:hypothetical protein GH714_018871 [Hevea brasiliensis]
MGDPPRSPTLDFYSVLGISKSATIKDMCKAYKSLATKRNPDMNPSNKAEAQVKFNQSNEACKAINEKKNPENQTEYEPTTPPPSDLSSPGGSYNHHKSMDESFFSGLLFCSRV